LAHEFIQALGVTIEPPTEILRLDDGALLAMKMTEAASYWGIEVPIAKRDRKTGNKKRKQEEIELLTATAIILQQDG
jgi:DNA (cytosine-5)-methyltransferase 1